MLPPFALLSDGVAIGQCYFKKISHLHFIQSHMTLYLSTVSYFLIQFFWTISNGPLILDKSCAMF